MTHFPRSLQYELSCAPGEKCRTLLGGLNLLDITDGNGDDDGPTSVDVLESRYVVIKWVLAYLFVIISCIILILILAIPYLVTGQTFRSLDSAVPRVDQEVSW